MKLLIFTFGSFFVGSDAGRLAVAHVPIHRGVPTTVHRAMAEAKSEAPRHGFADADLGEDPSVKFMRGTASQEEGRPSHTKVAPDVAQSPHEVQLEVEDMMKKIKHLDNAEIAASFASELSEVEASLAKKGGDAQLLGEINSVRAGLCADRSFKRDACLEFMNGACGKVGSKMVGVPNLYCMHFFQANATGTGGINVAADFQGMMDKNDAAGGAPAAAPAGAPGVFGGKGDRPLASQGFMGDDVQHVDKETMIEDWQTEFGPRSGHRSFNAICKDHPNNEWCRLHGYYERPKRRPAKAGAGRTQVGVLAAVFALAATWSA